MIITQAVRNATEGNAVPWSSRARRFAANLRALASRDEASAALVREAAAQLPEYELHLAADGNYQVRHIAGDPPWLGGLNDHKLATSLWQFDRAQTPVPHPIVFDGIGFGWLFLHVLRTTERSYLNYSCAVYVVEPDPLALAMALHMHDLQEALASPRLRWFIAEDDATALAAFRAGVEAQPTWTVPERYVRCALRARPPLPLEATIQTLHSARLQQRDVCVATANDYYAGKDAAFWRQRYTDAASGGAKLRVLGITSRYTTVLQHSMAELHAAATTSGADMRIAMEPDDHSVENPFIQMIAEFKPDLLVQISRMRYENPHLPRNVPFLCWDQDNLPCMRTPGATASLDDLTFVAGHGATFGYSALRWPERNCIFCHPAGATFRYAGQPIAPEVLAQYACDIGFISNASATPEQIQQQQAERWRGDIHLAAVFAQAGAEILRRMDTGTTWEYDDLRALVRRTAEARRVWLDETGISELGRSLGTVADRCFRHSALYWAARFCQRHGKTLRLYGRGWEMHPHFAQWAAGPAEPGAQMHAIYQASSINLQLIESGFIHSRSLDGMAAGGFFLTRHTAADGENPTAIEEIHRLGRWLAQRSIQSPEELLAVADDAIRQQWRRMLAFHPWEPAHAIRVLKVWAETPHSSVVFPMLPQITFRDEESFARLAIRYLDGHALRRTCAAEMRQIVLERFSYLSRWNQFLSHITQALALPLKESA